MAKVIELNVLKDTIDVFFFFTDDLEVAPDFFSYFQATRPLLATDRSLLCVSAWNDNGKELHINKQQIGKCNMAESIIFFHKVIFSVL